MRCRFGNGAGIVALTCLVSGGWGPAFAQNPPEVNVPAGMVSYFTQSGQSQCPDGWQIASYAVGYLALAVTDPGSGGVSVGDALQDQQPPLHDHAYSGNAPIDSHKSASGSGSTSGISSSGNHSIDGTSTSDSINYPLLQYTVCEATMPSGTDDVPVGSYAFFSPSTTACPDGWAAATPFNGYFPLPANAQFRIGTVSGSPISVSASAKTIGLPTHSHSYSSTIDIDSISFTGMAGSSKAKGGASPVQVTATLGPNTSPVIPTVALLMCEKTQTLSLSSNMPLGMSVFFSAQLCPANFGIAAGSSGNFLIGIDDKGTQGATFGGAPIAFNQTAMPSHVHSMPDGAQVDLGNNSTWVLGGNDYTFGKGGNYTYSGASDATEVALSYAPLMLCTVTAQDGQVKAPAK